MMKTWKRGDKKKIVLVKLISIQYIKYIIDKKKHPLGLSV